LLPKGVGHRKKADFRSTFILKTQTRQHFRGGTYVVIFKISPKILQKYMYDMNGQHLRAATNVMIFKIPPKILQKYMYDMNGQHFGRFFTNSSCHPTCDGQTFSGEIRDTSSVRS
jgi:hypothetical protein